MLLTLHREDIKLINLTDYLRAFHNDYNVRLAYIEEYQRRDENMYGSSEKQKQLIQLYMIFYLMACVYIESERGFNTTYEYFDNKYDFDTLRSNLVCMDIDIDYFFALFQLFPDDVQYPPDYTWVTEPGSGTTPNYMTINDVDLVKGYSNIVTHNNGSAAMYVKVIYNDWTQALNWSKVEPYVNDPLNEVAINAPFVMNDCTVILGF